jgi:hypothetical protein
VYELAFVTELILINMFRFQRLLGGTSNRPLLLYYFVFLSLISGLFFSCSSCNNEGITYYVSQNGNDANSGLSVKYAWQTIQKINSVELNPGDQVLFEGGQSFPGTIILSYKDEGAPHNRVYFSSFGNGRATINGGNYGSFEADSCSFLSIVRLILTGSGRNYGNTKDGLYITNSDSLFIDSVEVSGFQHSGIHLQKCSQSRLTNVFAHDNGFAGIHITGKTAWDSAAYDNQNVYIGYCKAENNPGDPSVTDNHSGSGIIASSVKNGTIEYCEALNNGWDMLWKGNGPVGIWIWDCTDFVIQYCISHDNKTSEGAADGGGFDFDGGVSASILQYCLSYNNEGPGVGLFEFGATKIWENNVVRYNISQDDGVTSHASLSIWRGNAGGTIRNCEIYNNVFYNSNPDGASLCLMNNWSGFNFRNNIFVYNGTFLMKGKKIAEESFQRNCYWNLNEDIGFLEYPDLKTWASNTGKETMDGKFIGLYVNPDFEVPGKTSLTDPKKLSPEFFKEYRLKSGSSLVDAGLDPKVFGIDPGKTDLLKNPVPQGKSFDIGAIENIQ